MEPGNGVHVEHESGVVVDKVVDVIKEEKGADTNVEGHENSNKVEENLDSSKDEVSESSGNVNGTKTKSSITSTSSKVVDNGPRSSALPYKPKPGLTQSSSFPAKTRNPDSIKTSVDGHPAKPRVVGSKAEAKVSNGSANKRVSGGVKPKEVSASGGGTSTRRATLDSAAKPRKSNGSEDCPASEDSLSGTSSGQRRNSVSGFSFRLDERAEKRKEFFSKIEEKIHAKETEKTTLQEKSKESQEAEIKQLRKSLTFKAAPMPKFYKEPPPKVELKKIPTTRPKSPKLGRNKSSVAAASAPALSPKVSRDQTMPTKTIRDKDTTAAAAKKPMKKSQPKPQAQATPSKTEKPIKLEDQEKEKARDEAHAQSVNLVEDWIQVNAEKKAAEESDGVLVSAPEDTSPAVGG